MIFIKSKETHRVIIAFDGKTPEIKALPELLAAAKEGDEFSMLPQDAPGVEITIKSPHLLYAVEENA